MATLRSLHATADHAWPSDLTHEQAATFTRWGWTAPDWQDLDTDIALTFGPTIVPLVTPQHRSEFTLREWLRNPPGGSVTSITSDMVAETVAAHGHHQASNILDVYAAGGSQQFVSTFLSGGHTKRNWPPTDVTTAWAIAQAAGLSEPAATGWALTGLMDLQDTTYEDFAGGSTAKQARMAADQIILWVAKFGPTSYLYVTAGLTLDEAVALKAAGTTPTENQLRVMAALNGLTLPAGV